MNFLFNGTSLRWMRDAKDGKLGLRFLAVDHDFAVRRGLCSYSPAASGSIANGIVEISLRTECSNCVCNFRFRIAFAKLVVEFSYRI